MPAQSDEQAITGHPSVILAQPTAALRAAVVSAAAASGHAVGDSTASILHDGAQAQPMQGKAVQGEARAALSPFSYASQGQSYRWPHSQRPVVQSTSGAPIKCHAQSERSALSSTARPVSRRWCAGSWAEAEVALREHRVRAPSGRSLQHRCAGGRVLPRRRLCVAAAARSAAVRPATCLQPEH